MTKLMKQLAGSDDPDEEEAIGVMKIGLRRFAASVISAVLLDINMLPQRNVFSWTFSRLILFYLSIYLYQCTVIITSLLNSYIFFYIAWNKIACSLNIGI